MPDLIEGRASWWAPTGQIPVALGVNLRALLEIAVADDPTCAASIELGEGDGPALYVAVGQHGVVWENTSVPEHGSGLVLRTWSVEGADVAPVPRDWPGVILNEIIGEAAEFFGGINEPRLLTVSITNESGDDEIVDVGWWEASDTAAEWESGHKDDE
jgi:hypothetical protein